jgi:hypothetical protein
MFVTVSVPNVSLCADYPAGYGPDQNTSADLLYSITDAAADMQVGTECERTVRSRCKHQDSCCAGSCLRRT